MTGGAGVDLKPDYYDGAAFKDIDKSVVEDLYKLIIPSQVKEAQRPAAPNFFLEGKSANGSKAVMDRQACHDGAHGARAMHSLQNYGRKVPIYDGNAYTFTSTYMPDLLQVFAHHVTAPTTPGGLPEYHMCTICLFWEHGP
ncbi:hypothetical protein QBC46DRAFT_307935 [Diplogelasinospora grovesii]|uniref:Uncharacterized protein n=1 Tax=Diplogelasinospora grovesii TaxID=303347 RepID=A0AAN6NCD2_9PEZI|nr:hypothetical protein QBC46DRAFT_307935 [Diplogelasinospora grovesii]